MDRLPLQFLVLVVAGWMNRHQHERIEYLQEENRVLREQLGGRRVRFSDVQRRRLARRAHPIGRQGLAEITTLVTADTLLRWYRQLVARKYDGSQKRGPGRPRTSEEVQRLILEMACDNPGWGYTRIQGALGNLGYEIGRNTIKRVLIENGLDPVGGRATTWKAFLAAHWEAIAANGRLSFGTLRGNARGEEGCLEARPSSGTLRLSAATLRARRARVKR